VSKKLIIIVVTGGLVSFAGAFAVGRLIKKAPESPRDELNQSALVGQESELPESSDDSMGSITGADTDSTSKKALTERQLKNLVYEVREKMQEYDNKLLSLRAKGQRLQIAQETLKKDIEILNNLRVELASTVASLKKERDKLLESRVEIAKAEKLNLTSIAATYDKMDSASASKILSSMCVSQAQGSGTEGTGNNMDDAVKILHYMSERTKAKLLAELVTSEPTLAAILCQKLKQVAEKK